MGLQAEFEWLRYRVMRLRTALRFAIAPETQSILRELIGDAEERLIVLEQNCVEPPRAAMATRGPILRVIE